MFVPDLYIQRLGYLAPGYFGSFFNIMLFFFGVRNLKISLGYKYKDIICKSKKHTFSISIINFVFYLTFSLFLLALLTQKLGNKTKLFCFFYVDYVMVEKKWILLAKALSLAANSLICKMGLVMHTISSDIEEVSS